MTKRGRILSYGFCGLLVVIGVAVAVAVSSTAGQVAGFTVCAVGFVLATSLVFYEVGLSEDRERERERTEREMREAQRREEGARDGAERERPAHERPSRVRLPRSRGRRRRIS